MKARAKPGANRGDGARAREREAERQEAIEALVLRDTALSEREIALFKAVFPDIMNAYFVRVWRVRAARDAAVATYTRWLRGDAGPG
ncbi:MAG: hypothetical protein QM820_37300 [Minicystis sp.]